MLSAIKCVTKCVICACFLAVKGGDKVKALTAAPENTLKVKLESHKLVWQQELKFRNRLPVLVVLSPENATLKYNK